MFAIVMPHPGEYVTRLDWSLRNPGIFAITLPEYFSLVSDVSIVGELTGATRAERRPFVSPNLGDCGTLNVRGRELRATSDYRRV
jgi:hypothetical protein